MSRRKEEFTPREAGKVAIYTCGPTVYNHIHIGNARTFISFDTIRRYLQWRGFDVTFVQNITDVDDKLINKANEQGRSVEEVATEYTAAFIDAMHAVGVRDPDVRPRATETIDDMISVIERLIASEHAYAVDGDVYFAVRSFPTYGKLSGRDVDEMRSGTRIEVDERKRDPLDFALWKAAKPGEPSWDSPWGKGRPGWHIECSAMSERELGLPFDIHGGGVDLVFPHHENEIAQSEAATGVPFANYWMHGGMLQINSEKMSKSLGNFTLLKDVLERYPAPVVRLFMLQTHYRSPLDFSDARLDEAKAAWGRIETFVRNARWAAAQVSGQDLGASVDDKAAFVHALGAAREKFIAEMDDDFNTAGALGSIFEIIRLGNSYLAIHEATLDAADAALLNRSVDLLMELLGSIGVELEHEHDLDHGSGSQDDKRSEAEAEVEELLVQRQDARAQKDWQRADELRDRIDALGYVIEDTAQGARLNPK
jgi:cysteinyl-tRNA synthetase